MSWDDEVGAGAIRLGNADSVELIGNPAPLVPLLRERAKDRLDVTIHLIDRSTIRGRIDSVADDGTTAVIIAGRDEYAFDTSALVVVQTAHRATEGMTKAAD